MNKTDNNIDINGENCPYVFEHTHDGSTHTHIVEDHDHDHGHDHDHDHDHGHDHNHGHNHEAQEECGHSHVHSHEHTKSVLNRLARASGHLNAVRRMVEDGRDCTEVLIQLAAVRSALDNTAKMILKDHIDHCIVDAVASNDKKALDELSKAIDSFIK